MLRFIFIIPKYTTGNSGNQIISHVFSIGFGDLSYISRRSGRGWGRAEQGLTMTQFQPIHHYTPLSHTIFIYISFDIHIVNACHTLPILNSVNTRLFQYSGFIRRRRCSRPRTRTMNGLTRRFVRDVRRCI